MASRAKMVFNVQQEGVNYKEDSISELPNEEESSMSCCVERRLVLANRRSGKRVMLSSTRKRTWSSQCLGGVVEAAGVQVAGVITVWGQT